MRNLFRTAAVVCVVSCASAFLVSPASARPVTSLTLSLRAEAEGSPVRVVTLTCSPNGGTHPHAAQACAALATVRGDAGALTSDVMCTMVYEPVVGTLNGRWRGRSVTFEHTYSNWCAATCQTQDVFRF